MVVFPKPFDVGQVLPFISRWDLQDELALRLREDETLGFGLYDGTPSPHMLTSYGIAPCAPCLGFTAFHILMNFHSLITC